MSYTLNTSVAPFCHSQDHPGGVPISACGVSTGFTPESSFSESEWLLGSRETLGTRHSCMSGIDQHHLSTSPLGAVDQFPLGRTDSCISGFLGHCGLGEESGLEIFHRDQVVMVGDLLGPRPGVVPSLPGGFLMKLRSFPAGTFVTV